MSVNGNNILWVVRSNYLLQQLHIASNFFQQTGDKTGETTAHTVFPTLTMTLNVAYKTHNKVDGHETYGSMTWGYALHK